MTAKNKRGTHNMAFLRLAENFHFVPIQRFTSDLQYPYLLHDDLLARRGLDGHGDEGGGLGGRGHLHRHGHLLVHRLPIRPRHRHQRHLLHRLRHLHDLRRGRRRGRPRHDGLLPIRQRDDLLRGRCLWSGRRRGGGGPEGGRLQPRWLGLKYLLTGHLKIEQSCSCY